MLFMSHSCTKYWCADNKVYIFKNTKPIFVVFFLFSFFLFCFDCICSDIFWQIFVLVPEWNIKLQIQLNYFYRYYMTSTVYLFLGTISENSSST